jgi:TrpR family transcriptional regulator, trp operon repressor
MAKKIDELANAFLDHRTPKEMGDFLKGMLTAKEIEVFFQRLAIVKMLKKGVPQRIIANVLRVGIGTVTRGSKELKRGRFKNVRVDISS